MMQQRFNMFIGNKKKYDAAYIKNVNMINVKPLGIEIQKNNRN